MFSLLRLLLMIVLFIVFELILLKILSNHKKRSIIISIIISVAIGSASALIPVENLFITFRSPQSAYNYVQSEEHNIIGIINGEQTALVIGKKGNTLSELIVPQKDGRWKIGLALDKKRKATITSEHYLITVEQYKDTTEHYVCVYWHGNGEIQLSDSQNSVFTPIIHESLPSSVKTISYYAYVQKPSQEYTVYVNGEDIPIIL